MTLDITRPLGKVVLIGAIVLLLLGVWGGSRALNGIQQAKLAGSAVSNLNLSIDGLDSSSLPQISSLHGRVSFVNTQLKTAQMQLTPFIQIAPFMGWVPIYGSRLRSSQEMLQLATSLAGASQSLLVALEIITSQTTQTNSQLLEGDRLNESIFHAVTSAEPFLRDSLAQLEQADVAIETLKDRDLPASFQILVKSAQNMTPSMKALARSGLAASELWESFFGYEGPRSYLLVAQNSDELRATGGFIPGAWVVTFDQGEIIQLEFWDTVDVDNLSTGLPLPPEGLLQSLWAGVWLFRDAGWFPDFPTSATVIEQIFELGQGTQVDGTIALDQWAFKNIVDALGPIPLYSGEVLDSESIMPILEEQTDLLGREFMNIALDALLNKTREQGTDESLLALLIAVSKSLTEKHMLMSFHDPALQKVVSRNGWSGALVDNPGDYIMVVDSNVGFSKVNRNISQRIDYSVDLSSEGESLARLEILYTNQSLELVPNSCAVQSAGRSGMTYEQQKNTCYWDYLRVYAPEGARLDSSSPFPMPEGALYRQIGYDDIEDTGRAYTESDRSVFAGLFNLESGLTKSFAFEYTLPPQVIKHTDDGLTYNLTIQKQPGTDAIPIVVNVHFPAGYCMRQAIPDYTKLEDDEVQFNLNLDSDIALEVDLERRSSCTLPDEAPTDLTVDLLEGRTEVAYGSVNVEPATEGSAPDRIQISPRDPTLSRGQRFLFTAVVLDLEGRPVPDVQIQWRVKDSRAGNISQTGLFSAGLISGRYDEIVEVSALSTKGTASSSTDIEIVTVQEAEERLLDSVILYPSDVTVRPAQTVGLGALGWDSRGRFVQNLQFEWRMADPAAGTVNQLGFFSGTSDPGHYPDAIEVTVRQDTANGIVVGRAFASVTVNESVQLGALTQVVTIPHRVVLTPGQQVSFVARAFDGSGKSIRAVEYTWEVMQSEAGRMTSPGNFVASSNTGQYPNPIQIVATQQTPNGYVQVTTTVAVTVIPPRVVGDLALVLLAPDEVTLEPGQRFVFTAFGMDANGILADIEVKWDIAESSAGSINTSGVFKAGSEPGRYTDAVRLRMSQNYNGQIIELEAYATVNVVGHIDSVSVTRTVTLESGRSAWFSAVGYDANGLEMPFLNFRWSIEDPEVGNITSSGFFTAGPEPGSYKNAIKVIAVELDST